METSEAHIAYLWQQLFDTKATVAELEELISYVQAHPEDDHSVNALEKHLTGFATKLPDNQGFNEEKLSALLQVIKENEVYIPHNHFPKESVIYEKEPLRKRVFNSIWLRYAAVLILIAGISALFFNHYQQLKIDVAHQVTFKELEILPGSDKAILTLEGGQQIQLDSSANEQLIAKGIINQNAQIIYKNVASVPTTNTLATPRGGQYKLHLADGTIVWLNAASSITYPTVFTGEKREVVVSGEAYFEVAPDKTKPFMVITPADKIQVLGTRFNANAYLSGTRAGKTSLLEGSIKVNNKLLKPGQAIQEGRIMNTDPDQDIAWKNGLFSFQNKLLPEVLDELARWYDIEVRYERNIPNIQLVGEMSRKMPLSYMLKGLEKLGLRYRMEGDILVVLP